MNALANPAARVAAVLAAGALAVPIIAQWEGVELITYRDVVGVPTVCYGHTATAVMGQRKTTDQCLELLAVDAVEHGVRIDRCVTRPLPPPVQAAFISFAYNVGVGAFCSSTLARKANVGDLKGACAELSRWVYAKGKVVKGLVNRRAAERAFCEAGIAA